MSFFNLFTPGLIQIMVESPQQCCPGPYLDGAVKSEAHQRNRPGDQSGDDGDETFEAVVADCEVFESLSPANEVSAILIDCSRHTTIISAYRTLSFPSKNTIMRPWI